MLKTVKKLTLGVLCAIFAGTAAQTAIADVSINFYTSNYVRRNDSTIAPVDTWVAQLIWTSDAAVGAMNASDPLAVPLGDQLLVQMVPDQLAGLVMASDYANTDTTPAPMSGASTTHTFTGAYAGGYVYARFFQTLTPVGGDYYNTSALSGALADYPSLNTYNVAGITMDQTIVPEPGTLALLGLGLAAVALRRRMRK